MLNKRLTLKGNFNIEGNIFDPDGKDSMNSSVKITTKLFNTDVWNVQIELKYKQAKPPFIFTE